MRNVPTNYLGIFFTTAILCGCGADYQRINQKTAEGLAIKEAARRGVLPVQVASVHAGHGRWQIDLMQTPSYPGGGIAKVTVSDDGQILEYFYEPGL